jgi:hypothetical protein
MRWNKTISYRSILDGAGEILNKNNIKKIIINLLEVGGSFQYTGRMSCSASGSYMAGRSHVHSGPSTKVQGFSVF